jgi:hypothetical protein
MNLPIKFGVPFVPSHIAHPSGISEDAPLNIKIVPFGKSLCIHSVETNFEELSFIGSS